MNAKTKKKIINLIKGHLNKGFDTHYNSFW